MSGPPRVARHCQGNCFLKHKHLQQCSIHATPWPIPAVPAMHFKFGVCSFVNVTFVFVGCLFISWAKQHGSYGPEIHFLDPVMKAKLPYSSLTVGGTSENFKEGCLEGPSLLPETLKIQTLDRPEGFILGPPAQMTSCSCREKAAESSLMVGQ